MPEKNNIPIFRNLDGVYYRVVRDGIHVNRCFSDLSEAEQDVIMAEYNTSIKSFSCCSYYFFRLPFTFTH